MAGTMDPFEFAFTLFSLILGLAVTAVLGGIIDALRRRGTVRVGWLTSMLALAVVLDLISFWFGAWETRAHIPITFGSLIYGAALAGIYYAAASLVFPEHAADAPDHDLWFMEHKQQVALGIFMANLLFSLGEVLVTGSFSADWIGRTTQIVYLAATLVLAFTPSRRASFAALLVMLGLLAHSALEPLLYG